MCANEPAVKILELARLLGEVGPRREGTLRVTTLPHATQAPLTPALRSPLPPRLCLTSESSDCVSFPHLRVEQWYVFVVRNLKTSIMSVVIY